MSSSLHWVDWLIVVIFMAVTTGVGLYFTKRAGKNIQSFFITGRSLAWYMAGISMVASAFASDTPLWISSLIRRYGVYYVWQQWSPLIGACLAVVLFARFWRRLGVLTDVEFIERRYSGKAASAVRFATAGLQALVFCPLIISWVTKSMEVITREAMGLPREYQLWTTMSVVVIAVILCAFSGLWGIVYTGFIQFIVATVGTILLAFFAVHKVGGLGAMVEQLSAMKEWSGHALNIAPSIGSGAMQMPIWNAIGYFGILWIGNAVSGGYMAQRLLACKDARHSTFAMLFHAIVYRGFITWPWIIVGLCSLIVFPNLGEGVSHDVAYPRMIVQLMPIALRGMLVAAMIAAFISTISTMFNWSSSYFVNDVYKRFIVRKGSTRHYVFVSRIATLGIGVLGGIISLYAKNIQQLLMISFVVASGGAVVGFLRWFWWRLNAKGDLAAFIASYVLTALLLLRVFDGPARVVLGLGPEVNFSTELNLLGARMLFVMATVTAIAAIVSLLTKPTEEKRLEDFVAKARPLKLFWKPVIRRMGYEYEAHETLGRTLVSWFLAMACVISSIFGVGKLLFGSPLTGIICMVVFAITLWLTIRRVNQDFADVGEEALGTHHKD